MSYFFVLRRKGAGGSRNAHMRACAPGVVPILLLGSDLREREREVRADFRRTQV